MQRLPPSIRSYAYTDSTRFEGLCEGLEAAKMHAIAKTVREQRAGLIVPSHALYTQERLLAVGRVSGRLVPNERCEAWRMGGSHCE